MATWTGSCGPRQLKDLERAIGKLHWEGRTHDEINGVVGGKERTSSLMSLFGAIRQEVLDIEAAIVARYDGKVTRENVREIQQAYIDALPEARESRPVKDERRSKDEDDELQAGMRKREAEWAAKRDAEEGLMEQVRAKAPASAQAVIIASYHQDDSDPMTDYFSNHATRTVAIGYRTGGREDFRQLRRAAASFPDTAHLGSQEALDAWHRERDPEGRWPHHPGEDLERRDNYSMGKGNYLSDHGWDGAGSGWVVKSYPLDSKWGPQLTEDAIGAAPQAPERAAETTQAAGITVRPGTREGYTEVVFDAVPPAETRQGLKDHGFRWSRYNKCWYGTDKAYAESLVAKPTCEDCGCDIDDPQHCGRPAPKEEVQA